MSVNFQLLRQLLYDIWIHPFLKQLTNIFLFTSNWKCAIQILLEHSGLSYKEKEGKALRSPPKGRISKAQVVLNSHLLPVETVYVSDIWNLNISPEWLPYKFLKSVFALLIKKKKIKDFYKLYKKQTVFGLTQWHIRGLNVHYLTNVLQMLGKTFNNTMEWQIYCLNKLTTLN